MIDFSSCGNKWSAVGQAQAIELEKLYLSTGFSNDQFCGPTPT